MAEDRIQTEQKQRPAGLKTEKKQTGQNLREIRVGFVGNPNCGKTTLFNAFTGANLKVANWPGVTVERVEGHTSYKGRSIKVIDLPGIYSLTSYTIEEIVTRRCIEDGEVDVIINVVDASSLERNLYLTLQLLELKKPVILSTGMSTLAEIEDAMSVLEDGGVEDITLLHCNTEYPTPFADANLRAMQDLASHFGCAVGYSDHTLGWEADIAAVALGACVIEKHFTLDKTLEGPDHKASLDPAELAAMVRAVRNTEQALGDGRKHVTSSEAKNKAIARKSIVARRAIAAGEAFTEENLTTKRPGDGVSPMRWHEVLGQTAKRAFSEDEKIEL